MADSNGVVRGGHLAGGAKVRTTAAVLVALLPAWSFSRELDPTTGFKELSIRHQECGEPCRASASPHQHRLRPFHRCRHPDPPAVGERASGLAACRLPLVVSDEPVVLRCSW